MSIKKAASLLRETAFGRGPSPAKMLTNRSHFLTLAQDQIYFVNLVAGLGFEPKTFGLCLLLQLSLLLTFLFLSGFVVWTMPFSAYGGDLPYLVSTPSLDIIGGLGSVLPF